jgi:phage shock protein PspC (stress-responsive transcriptional regulator)
MVVTMNRRLYRSSSDRALCGVCGGIAEYFDVDSVIIRLLVVVFALTGAGILFYIFAAIIIREKPEIDLRQDRPQGGASHEFGGAESYGAEFRGEASGDAGADTRDAVEPRRRSGGGRNSGIVIFGLILIIVGVFYLINLVFPFFRWIDMRVIVAIILVFLGIYFVARR